MKLQRSCKNLSHYAYISHCKYDHNQAFMQDFTPGCESQNEVSCVSKVLVLVLNAKFVHPEGHKRPQQTQSFFLKLKININ